MQTYIHNGGIEYPTEDYSWATEIEPGYGEICPPQEQSALELELVKEE